MSLDGEGNLVVDDTPDKAFRPAAGRWGMWKASTPAMRATAAARANAFSRKPISTEKNQRNYVNCCWKSDEGNENKYEKIHFSQRLCFQREDFLVRRKCQSTERSNKVSLTSLLKFPTCLAVVSPERSTSAHSFFISDGGTYLTITNEISSLVLCKFKTAPSTY